MQVMMTKFLIGVMFWTLLFPLFPLQAQTNKKAAVKLGSGATVKNTIIWRNDSVALIGGGEAISSFIKDGEADSPGFIDASNGEFRLGKTSVCKDRGTDDNRLGSWDLWGNKRVSGESVDQGACECTQYRVRFKKSEYVDIIPVEGTDSVGIDPGGRFAFKLKINIENIEIWDVTIEEAGKVLEPTASFLYYIENIQADITLIIELTPSVTIGLDPVDHGELRIKVKGKTIPRKESGQDIRAINLEKNTCIRIDTSSDLGYYCKNVWVKTVEDTDRKEAMEWVGDSTYKATVNANFSAEFLPHSYPVETSWNTGGRVKVKNIETSKFLYSESAISPQTIGVNYLIGLEVQMEAAEGYMLESCKITRKNGGAEVGKGTGTGEIRNVKVEVGGLIIKVIFSKLKHRVVWNSEQGGTLEVVKNGSEQITSGTSVEEGTVLTISSKPNEGYILNSLKATPVGGNAESLGDGDSWEVLTGVTFIGTFEKAKCIVNFETNTPLITENNWQESTPSIEVNYNDKLLISTESKIGYRCDSIQVNGKCTNGSSLELKSIKTQQKVKAWFNRIGYVLNVTEETPTLGKVKIEIQEHNENDWKEKNPNQENIRVYHYDKLKVTAMANPGYKIKKLTINGTSYSTSGEMDITEDVDVVVEFEPELLSVEINKLTGPEMYPNAGEIIVESNDKKYSVTLTRTDIQKRLLDVPYGTKLYIKYVSFDLGFQVTRLDTIVSGQTGQLENQFFTVSDHVVLNIEIKDKNEYYNVAWTKIGCDMISHKVNVTGKDGTAIISGKSYKVGTSFKVQVTPKLGYSYYFNQGDKSWPLEESHLYEFSLQNDVDIKIEFVRLREVVIRAPEGTEINVYNNRQKLAHGAKVRAGEKLVVSFQVKESHKDSIRSLELIVNDTSLWENSDPITNNPITSGNKDYQVKTDCEEGDVVFEGVSAIYYRLKYNSAINGDLEVKMVDGTLFKSDQDYWLLKGTELEIRAAANEGWKHDSTTALTPPNLISENLELEIVDEGVYRKKIAIEKDLIDITALFSKKIYTVELQIKPEKGGSVVIYDGLSSILTQNGQQIEKPYETMLKIMATSGLDYELSSIRGGDEELGSVSGIKVNLVQDTVLTVIFKKMYIISFDDNLRVMLGQTELSSGDRISEGSLLDIAYIGSLDGYNCTEFSVAAGGSSSLFPLGSFDMPENDVYLSAELVKKEYRLNWTIDPGDIGARIYVKNKTNGETYNNPGGIVSYGDILEPIVVLPEDPKHENKTFYEIDSFSYTFDQLNINSLSYVLFGDLEEVGEAFDVKGDTDIALVLKRKTRALYVKINPLDIGFIVEITQGSHVYNLTKGSIQIPVGERFIARVIDTNESQSEYELKYFPEEGKTNSEYTMTMPYGDYALNAKFELKKAEIKFFVEGEGTLTVDGLPGGVQFFNKKNSGKIRTIDYLTKLNLSVLAQEGNYNVDKFMIHLNDGREFYIADNDTVLSVKNPNMIVEAVFLKYYDIVYHQAEVKLNLLDGENIPSGSKCDGGETLSVQVQKKGYDVKFVKWNENEAVKIGSVYRIVLPEDADYDTVKINVIFEIQNYKLEVEHPDEGKIVVERLSNTGDWVIVDVSMTQNYPYGTKIRARVEISLQEEYELDQLFINGQNLEVGYEMLMEEDTKLTAKIIPRLYTVTYEHPMYGSLLVETTDGEEVMIGSRLPYLTEFEVTAEATDPIGYSVVQVLANSEEFENETTMILKEDTHISAKIAINCWKVVSRVVGEGDIKLIQLRGDELILTEDSLDHYEKVKISLAAAKGWIFHSLDVFGAELKNDTSFIVENDVEVNAVFKEKEALKFPAIFTPNGDGINDIWEITGFWQLPESELQIFNRNEQRVYKIASYQNDWEGITNSGELLPAGEYVYKLTSISGEIHMGLVTIIRN